MNDFYDTVTAMRNEAVEFPDTCRCSGGWLLSDYDTFHKCPTHYEGQPHPEDQEAWEEWDECKEEKNDQT